MIQSLKTSKILLTALIFYSFTCQAEEHFTKQEAKQKAMLYLHKKMTVKDIYCWFLHENCNGDYNNNESKRDGEKLKKILYKKLFKNVNYPNYNKNEIHQELNNLIKPAIKKLIIKKITQINNDYPMSAEQIANEIVSWIENYRNIKPYIGNSLNDKIRLVIAQMKQNDYDAMNNDSMNKNNQHIPSAPALTCDQCKEFISTNGYALNCGCRNLCVDCYAMGDWAYFCPMCSMQYDETICPSCQCECTKHCPNCHKEAEPAEKFYC